jgi:hypothetical protein
VILEALETVIHPVIQAAQLCDHSAIVAAQPTRLPRLANQIASAEPRAANQHRDSSRNSTHPRPFSGTLIDTRR